MQIASNIVQKPLHSRSGFGAFRHFADIYDDSIRLVLNSGRIRLSLTNALPEILRNPDFLYILIRRYYLEWRGFALRFIVDILGNPTFYDPPALWTLFWALVKAEHRFLYQYTPPWSHEERLTGHFVSQLIERLEEFSDYWNSLSQISDPPVSCQVWYTDTATARREGITGADLGLIIHAKLPGQDEFFKSARFQAKKVDHSGRVRINLDQTRALLQREKRLGYYLFYHRFDKRRWSLAPTVQAAAAFKSEIDKARDHNRKEVQVSAWEEGYDFAMFMTFALADPTSEEIGVYTTNGRDAVSSLIVRELPFPSRILVVTLGDTTSVLDWPDLLREHIEQSFE